MQVVSCDHLFDDRRYKYRCHFCDGYVCLKCSTCSRENKVSCKACLQFQANCLDIDKFYWIGEFYRRVANDLLFTEYKKTEKS